MRTTVSCREVHACMYLSGKYVRCNQVCLARFALLRVVALRRRKVPTTALQTVGGGDFRFGPGLLWGGISS